MSLISELSAKTEKEPIFSPLQSESHGEEFAFVKPPRKLPNHLPLQREYAILEDFDHDLLLRNEHLQQTGAVPTPKLTKTGTTIVGCVYEGGVVLGADTRATEGDIVADKNCEKIHYLAPNIYCCGAGTAADTEYTTGMIESKLELHRLNESGRTSRMRTALTMLKQYLFQYQGHIGAALVLGGCDPVDGPQLFTVYPHGSTDRLPFVSMGSGSLAAMAVLESGWRPQLSEAEAVTLISSSIKAGIFNDLGSGSNVDVCVIRRDLSVDYKRNFELAAVKSPRSQSHVPPVGTTKVLRSSVQAIEGLGVTVVPSASTASSGRRMDIDQE
jgi:20S proteasome subunit beta 2